MLATTAGAAEERLIPIDAFSIIVSVNDPPAEVGRREGLRVSVMVGRGAEDPAGQTRTSVTCPGISVPMRTLEQEEVAVFQKACDAALQGKDFREEVRVWNNTTTYEVVTVDGQKRVSLRRGGQVLLAPEEGARLKESLAQAAAAEAWYQKLLAEPTLPVKTAAARPPKAADFFLISRLGEVAAEGVGYEVSLTHYSSRQRQPYQVTHGMNYFALGGTQCMVSGDWVRDMMDEVARALRAVAKGKKFEVTAGRGRSGDGFTVAANLETQKADVSFDTGGFPGKHSPVQASFSQEHLAAIEKLAAGGAAREKWFAEHEEWFFEKE